MHAYHTKHSIHQVTILSDLKLACYIYVYTIVLDVYKFPVCIFSVYPLTECNIIRCQSA